MRRRPTVWALTLGVTLIAGCGGSDGASSATSAPAASIATTTAEAPAPVEGLVATIETSRLYGLRHAFALGLQNVGDEPVTVRRIQLESPLYAPVAMVDEGVLLQPGGRRFLLPVPYGDARCDAAAEAIFGAVVVLDDGTEVRLRAAEDDPGSIGRLHDRECAAEDVRERVDLRFGDRWTTSGNDVSGVLVLEQLHPGPPVAVEDAVGSVIFTIRFDVAGPPIVAVSDDEPAATVAVTISATRCDPHALAESKRSFIFLTWVTVGDGEPIPLELEPTGEARAALEAVLYTCRS